MKNIKLVYGVGINDVDYPIDIKQTVGYKEDGSRIRKRIWSCPYYNKWLEMMRRCYSQEFIRKRPTYEDCSVVPEWHHFSKFHPWMEKQNWQDKQLDKDLLIPGNKVYGPETCIFVDSEINSFILECNSARGDWPIGVDFHKASGKFRAMCKDVSSKDRKYLGLFDCPKQAHEAWLAFKLKQAKILAEKQTDIRVSEALIGRYEFYVS